MLDQPGGWTREGVQMEFHAGLRAYWGSVLVLNCIAGSWKCACVCAFSDAMQRCDGCGCEQVREQRTRESEAVARWGSLLLQKHKRSLPEEECKAQVVQFLQEGMVCIVQIVV